MDIFITARELTDKGLWMRYCEITGTNEWAVNEGLLDDNDRLFVDNETAKELNLING
jgi:hypothetical protein